jgi:hypothetical protein
MLKKTIIFGPLLSKRLESVAGLGSTAELEEEKKSVPGSRHFVDPLWVAPQ